MVPPASHKVSRVSWYSGAELAVFFLRLRACHPLWGTFPGSFGWNTSASLFCPQPQRTSPLVWALSLSLAATWKIEFSFSSYGYLDVSVPRVSPRKVMYWPHGTWVLFQVGFPIRTSQVQSLFAAPLGFSQLATSFFGFRYQGIRPMLLLA